MRMTTKQRQILDTMIQLSIDESGALKTVDMDEIIESLPYKTTKQSFQFSLRALIKHDMVEKGEVELRRHRNRRPLFITEKALSMMRVDVDQEAINLLII